MTDDGPLPPQSLPFSVPLEHVALHADLSKCWIASQNERWNPIYFRPTLFGRVRKVFRVLLRLPPKPRQSVRRRADANAEGQP